jgi:ubiquinone/menaquinone biosynthesis C-methylase UbiE
MKIIGEVQITDKLIEHNREMHDALASLYERRHDEIFNPTEQRRIRDLLRSLLVKNFNKSIPRVLDFGAGTGNLTKQLLKFGAAVVAADVSEGILMEMRVLTGRQNRLGTMVLNGRDLTGVDSDSFDMVATYSVLHHVPDYLAIVDEFIRVVKPGGIIYIDHEVCPSFWKDNAEYQQYCHELAEFYKSRPDGILKRLMKLLTRKGCLRYVLATLKLRGNRIVDDGDIHVYEDDHIEWSTIRQRLEPFCEIMGEKDYLVCREQQESPFVWSRWRDRCVDMRFLVARKK